MSENFTEALISAVKLSRILWDMSHKHYHNRLFVDKEWTRIASDLGESKDAVKAKWKNLRDNFRKEFKKIPKCRSGDDNEQAPLYQGSWVHFHSLLFLKSVFTPRNTQSNIERPENSSHSQLEDQQDASQSQDATLSENEQIQVTQCEESQRSKSHTKTHLQREIDSLENELPDKNEPVKPIEIVKKRKIQYNHSTNFEQEMLGIEKKKIELLNKGDVEDDDIHFFKSLLPHATLLPPLDKLAFRSAVQNLLANAIIKVQTQENRAQQVQTTVQRDGAGSSYVASPYPSPAATFLSSASDVSQHSNQYEYEDSCFLTLP